MADLAGFTSFLRGAVGVPTASLPDGSQAITDSYALAVATVNLQIAGASPAYYDQAVYNLGADFVINSAQDPDGADPFSAPDNEGKLPLFQYLRAKWKIYDFAPGVVQSTGDESTNTSLVVQKAAEDFTLDDLQRLKTPYGRRYLQIAQKAGTLWGLT